MAEEPSAPPDVPAADAPEPDDAGCGDGRHLAAVAPRHPKHPLRSRRLRPQRRSAAAEPDAPVDELAAADDGGRARARRRRAVREAAVRGASTTAPTPSAAAEPEPRRRRRRRAARPPPTAEAADEPGRAEREPERGAEERTPPTRPPPRSRRRPRRAPPTTSSRRGKRALQDEQNDLLDGLRRQRGKIDTAKVLPALEDQLARWAHVLQPAVDAAYAAGAASGARRPAGVRSARRPGRCSPSSPPAVVVTAARAALELARVDRRPHPGRHRDRHRAEPRRPLPGVAGRAARGRAGRRAGGRLLAGRVRRRARRCPPAVGAGRRGEVPRLRRQRARADGEGRATSRPGSRTRRRTRGVAACSWSRPPERRRRPRCALRDHRSL